VLEWWRHAWESGRGREGRGGNGLLGWSLGFGVLCCMLAVRASGLYLIISEKRRGGWFDRRGGILI
jgi:hypothetical protein